MSKKEGKVDHFFSLLRKPGLYFRPALFAKASSGFKKDRKTIVTAGYEGGKLQISFLQS